MPSDDPLELFSPVTRTWFARTFTAPSPPQLQGWPVIARGEHTLLLAPTGSGKTLAAFLFCLDQVARHGGDGVQVLYVSPLKALSNDLYRNLELPLAGMREVARELGQPETVITVGLRTGDTPAKERARLGRQPPHVLVTTPESLYLILTSRARETLRAVRYVIVDEIHAVAGSKRGVHLALSLERLEALIAQAGGRPPVRIGLSATLARRTSDGRPALDQIARFLGGERPVTVVDAGGRKRLELTVACPSEELEKPATSDLWATYPKFIAAEIARWRTTLVFVNNRRSAERLCTLINETSGNETSGREIARVHHGAMSRAARESVESDLKAGRIPALVCTSSLELGIDMGAIDLVIQLESPGGIARALQRIGRAGHTVDAPARGLILPKFRGDLAECAALARAMDEGAVEAPEVPERCLDVLAQQIVAMAAVESWTVAGLLATVRRAWPYRDLSAGELDAVLEMLGGRYPAEEFADLRPRIVWDRAAGLIRGRPGALRLAVTSGGTIPDKGLYAVELGAGGPRLGELDEEFVFESHVGDAFQLGTGTWRIEAISASRVTVSPAPGEAPRLPFWKGEGPGRTAELGDALGALHRRYEEDGAGPWLAADHHLDERGVRNVAAYLDEQRAATGVLPTDRRVVVEHFVDDVGDFRVALHAPLGPRVTTPLGILLARRLAETGGVEPTWQATADGLLLRLPAAERPPPDNPLTVLVGVDVERVLLDALGDTALFGARFRENAARALLLPRRSPGKRTPLYLQRLRARDLYEVARRHADFPVLVETYRECLRDAWDLPRLGRLLGDVAAGRVEVAVRPVARPSPMARAMLLGFVSSYLYQDDLPRAERRAQLLPVGRGLLAEVLRRDELRSLIDPAVLADEEARSRRTAPLLLARDSDELHDRLTSLGPLDVTEAAARLVEPARAAEWLDALVRGGRAVQRDDDWYAAEDVVRYDAAHAGDAAAADALVRRAVRASGPEPAESITRRARLPGAVVAEALVRLEARGEIAGGHFRPSVDGGEAQPRELVDAGLLERLSRRSLAAARRAVQPVPAARYASFLLGWQRLLPATRLEGPAGLGRLLDALAGGALPAAELERELLARRLRSWDPSWLDRAISDGEWAFVCRRARVTFWPRAELGPVEPPELDDSTATGRVVAYLAARGASFYTDLWHATELDVEALGDALWALLGEGLVTNDRYEPLRRGRASIAPERPQRARLGRPSGAGGRWSLVGRPPVDAAWWAVRLLDRYGVVAHEHVAAEEPPVTWRELSDEWQRMELRGQVRRGYFVEGWSGAQFAWPDAVEQLRAADAAPAVAVCAADPVCGLLPLAMARLPSNFVVVENGQVTATLETAAKRLRTHTDGEALDRAAAALATIGGTIEVAEIDGGPALPHAAAARLLAVGFERDGAQLRRSPLRVRLLQ